MHMTHTHSRVGARPALVIATLLIIVLLGVFPAAAQSDMSTDCGASSDFMTQGQVSALAGDYEMAAWAFNCAIEADPTNYLARFWRGGLAGSQGDTNQLGSDLFAFYSHRSGKNDPLMISVVKTIPDLGDAITAHPDDTELYTLRGLAYTITGLPHNAQPDFDQVIELAPDNAVGYLFRWFIDSNQSPPVDFGDPNLTKGIELAPDSLLVDWLYSFPAIDLSQAVAEAQLTHFEDVMEWHPDHPFAFETRGVANAMLKDDSAATSNFYQHVQNTLGEGETLDQAELPFDTLLKLDAAAGNVYRIPFTAQAGQKVNIVTARSDSAIFNVFPVTPIVLDPAGEVMDAPYRVNVAMGGTTTPIVGLEIPAAGTYTLLVTPNYSGEVQIALTEAKISGM